VPIRNVTRWYLEMTAPEQLAEAPDPDPELEVRQAEIPSPELSRFFYTAVGGPWFWIDRRTWTREQWLEALANVETWVAYVRGTPAGYAELRREDGAVELAHFGLLGDFIGRGLGPRLLHAALSRAWELRPERVTVNTCSLDGPAALRTYERAGFRIREQRDEQVTLPEAPPGAW
jgi:ribosomal protein S18 acetylase RimI-like enzyme